jgi:hypothetical protein
MAETYLDYFDYFEKMDNSIKITDIPAIISVILDLPFPYVNLGVFHPAFAPFSDLT